MTVERSRFGPLLNAITIWGIAIFALMFFHEDIGIPSDTMPFFVFGGFGLALLAGFVMMALPGRKAPAGPGSDD